MMTSVQRKLLKYIGVPLFYLSTLVLFIRLTFPYETLKGRLIAQFNATQKDKRLEIDELSGSGLFGIEAEGLRLIQYQDQKPTSDQKVAPPLHLGLERAAVSVSPLSLLFGKTVVSFDADAGGGEIEG
ncbi:MAG: type II secretion system protein GspN, partial [Polyangiaceae bacterium]|nr:type II secretion system protein GspN [Polyangiaceae bacterium]